jgi:hypothetical protein
MTLQELIRDYLDGVDTSRVFDMSAAFKVLIPQVMADHELRETVVKDALRSQIRARLTKGVHRGAA